MWRRLVILGVIAATALVVCGSAPARPIAPTAPPGEVAIFYYPWYGTPERDGSWQHWDQRGHSPPAMIASGWYPTRGPYSSSDPAVVRAQMREIASAGVDSVVVSWWGAESAEELRLALVMRATSEAGLRVAIHVEPYPGRTPAALLAQVQRLATLGIEDFYVYDSTASPDADWAAVNAARPAGVRLFANTGLPGKATAGGFSGLYTYDVYIYDGSSFARMCASARARGLACAPSVGPGYDASRSTGDPRTQSRRDGRRYDRMWRGAVRSRADIVTITSYNEWHEGTQIEPARGVAGGSYASYDGAWGATGRRAEVAYLQRTADWAGRYRAVLTR